MSGSDLLGQYGVKVRVSDLPPTLPIVLPLCRQLRIASIVDQLIPMKPGEHLTHGQVTEFLLLHLLQAPHRLPLYELADWAAEHHLQALYGHAPAKFNDDRIGRTLDALGEYVMDIQAAVVSRALQQYAIAVSAIHWDLTSVTFSDAKQASELIGTGYGGGTIHRRQVQMSLHTTDDGAIPVRHEILAGKAHQAPLAGQMLQDLRQRWPASNLIIVSDRAGISYENIVAYRQAQAHFVAPLSLLQPPLQQALAAVPADDFAPLRYRSMNAAETGYRYYATSIQLQPQRHPTPITVEALFVLSEGLQQRTRERRAAQMAQAQARLEEINGHLQAPERNKRGYARREYAQRQIEKAIPAAVRPLVRYELTGEAGAWQLRFWMDEAAAAQAAAADGRYVLVHDLPLGHTPDQIFELHRRQGRIEARFRNFSQELSVHPLWLHKEARIVALLLIFVLALLVYSLLEWLSERAGLDTSYYHKMTAREMMKRFRRLQLMEVRVRGQPPQREIELNDEQRYILRALGFTSPMRYLP
jgi:transposase